MAVGTNVYAVSGDTDSTGKSHIVVYTKSTLAEQTTPEGLALTDVSKNVSAVSFGDPDMDTNHGGSDASRTPPVSDANIRTYESCLATDAASSGRTLAGSMTVGTYVYAVSSATGLTGKSHFVVYMKSTMAVRTSPATLARIDVTEGASAISFG